MGAIASGGVVLRDDELIAQMRVSPAAVERVIAAEQVELARREQLYRGSRPPLDVRNRTIILVDDGLATGASVLAAVEALKRQGPASIVVASPVGSREACHAVAAITDGCLCPAIPHPFYAVGFWYEDFSETTDDEVRTLLARAVTSRASRVQQEA
jgi:predicted phosphoribosyltransferase